MSTRVIQLSKFASGFRDPVTDVVLAGGNATFFVADGTYSVAKNAYEDIAKASAITGVTLDAHGAYPNGLYFDGSTVYDIRIKDSAGVTKYSFTSNKIPDNTENVRTVTAASVTATIDDDVILCDTTSNAITVNLYAVANSLKSITIKNIGAALNNVTVDPNGAELIDGLSTDTLLDGDAQTYSTDNVQWYGASNSRNVSGAFIYTATGEAVATGAGAALSAYTEDYDTGGWYDAGAPTRLTVPSSGVSKIRVGANVEFTAAAGGTFRLVGVNKNGTGSYIGFTKATGEPNATVGPYVNLVSGQISVDADDYFELFIQHDVGSNNTITANFWIEKVQS